MSQTSLDRVNSRRVGTHEKNSGDAVRRLGPIIQSIFCAQSGASIRLTVRKWSGESRYPGPLPPMLDQKSFVAPFNPARLTAPGSPRMTSNRAVENLPPTNSESGQETMHALNHRISSCFHLSCSWRNALWLNAMHSGKNCG